MSADSDLDVREKALNPASSFIVQAPAGSGKTELLIQRFLTLLAKVEKPERILAITFTRKAAGEMRSRILEALHRGTQDLAPQQSHDQRTWELARLALNQNLRMNWHLLENPSRLKIQTIDSFCAFLTKQMPLLSGFGNQPLVHHDPEEFYQEAARRTILQVEDPDKNGETLRAVLKYLDNSISDARELLAKMLERRDQWKRHIPAEMDRYELKKLLEKSLKNLIEDTLLKAKKTFPQTLIEPLISAARYAASNLSDEKSPIARLNHLYDLNETLLHHLPIWEGLSDLLLTQTGTWRKLINKTIGFPSDSRPAAVSHKNSFKALLNQLEANEPLRHLLKKIRLLPPAEYDEKQWEILNSFLHLLPLAEKQLWEIFGREGVVDFIAISEAAEKALGTEDNPTDLLLSLDLMVHHILVDEYQDTSYAQHALLVALTRGWEQGDGRTLFIVGDPMQSIYLFRKAEVGIFLHAREHGIGTIHLEPLTLTRNFRSQAKIVEWINQTFQSAFPDEEDIFKGSVPYNPSTAVRPSLEGMDVKISVYIGCQDERESSAVLETIKEIQKSKEPHETIAILARSRSHMNLMISELSKQEIPYRSLEIDKLYGRPVIQDLFALLRAIIHPCDRVAWLSILRAPWCGLSLSDIHKICVNNRHEPIWKLIQDKDRFSSLTEEGQKRLQRLMDKLRPALALRNRIRPRDLLEGLWIALGGPACVPHRTALKDADLFFDMVDSMSIGGEIGTLSRLEVKLKNLYANTGDYQDHAVEILTMHNAKGLEFDYVILPGLGKEPPLLKKELLLWMEKQGDLIMSPIPGQKERKYSENNEDKIYAYLTKLNQEKQRLEQSRLFYVAATRARKQLFLFGNIQKKKESGEMFIAPGSLLGVLKINQLFPFMIDQPARDEGEFKNLFPKIPVKLKRLPAAWNLPLPENPLPVETYTTESASELDKPVFNWAGRLARILGSVLHRYLMRIAKEGLEKWNIERIKKEKHRFETLLVQQGMTLNEAAISANKAMTILCNTLEDPRGRWILDYHLEDQSEMPVTGIIDGKIVHSVLDRSFIDQGILWIIDYKTGSHEGSSVKDFLEEEKIRYQRRMDLYASIMLKKRDPLPIKKGLYYPALTGWIEW